MSEVIKTGAAAHNQPTVLRPQNMSELMAFAQLAAKSSMMPRDYLGKPENVVIAVQLGSELGLAPMQSIQNIAVISGRPAVFGDAMPALCRQSAVCEDIEERFEGDGERLTAVCVAKRVGKKPITQTFSVDDAKKAGLWGKAGPWQQYPKRMLQMRARGFALRDAFPDVLRGLISVEEAQDIPPDTFTGTTIEATTDPSRTDLPPAPEHPFKRQTLKEWLAEFRANCEAAQTQEGASVVLDGALVMADFLATRPAAQAQYDAIRDACIHRLWADPPEPEGDEVVIAGAANVGAG